MNKENKKSDRAYSYLADLIIVMTVVVANIIIFTLGNLLGLRYYYQDEYDYALSGHTDELFEEAINAGKKVKISFCMPENDVKVHTTGREVYITAKELEERYPDFIELDYVNIITKQNKDGELVNLSKYKIDKNLVDDESTEAKENEIPIYKTSVIIECGEEYKLITDRYTSAGFSPFYTLDSSNYITAYNGEEVFAAMIRRVISKDNKIAYFTQHHGETADIAITNLLGYAGYTIKVVDLRKSGVPEDADLLVISNPTSDFEAAREGSDIYAEIDRLEAYVNRGGNLYVALDPYVKKLNVLEGFLAEYGIKFSTSEDADGKIIRNMIKDSRNAITTDGFTLTAEFASNDTASKISKRVSKYSDGGVIIREVSALELSGNAKPILISSSSSALEAGGKTVSTSGSYCIAATSEYAAKDGKVSKIFVIPSIYLSVSDALTSREYSNKDFMYSLLQDFYGGGIMPYGCREVMYASQVLENLTMGAARIYTAIAVAIPAAVAITGAVVIIRRRNR